MSSQLITFRGDSARLADGGGVFSRRRRSRARRRRREPVEPPSCWRILRTEEEIRVATEHALEQERASAQEAVERELRHERSLEGLAGRPGRDRLAPAVPPVEPPSEQVSSGPQAA